MRGKEPELGHSLRTERITPAYAGKSLPTTLVSRSKRDHPRVCGEKRQERLQPVAACGSPPRMRGKATPSTASGCGVRITPAYAGKRQALVTHVSTPEDHPRVCGEKNAGKYITIRHTGSPPRMRGKGILAKSTDWQYRITPAYAGKSDKHQAQLVQAEDHPRVCGEKSFRSTAFTVIPGSPPRMRGKGTPCGLIWSRARITPAYAGKSE